MSEQGEQILLIESSQEQESALWRVLETSGYSLCSVSTASEALSVLSQEKPDLVIVAEAVEPPSPSSYSVQAGEEPLFDTAADVAAIRGVARGAARRAAHAADGYEICRAVKSAPAARLVPLLLVVSSREECALPRGLEAGADYLLFGPHQEQDVLRSVRNALLNGASPEATWVFPGVEVIHRDRVHTVTAGRGRLARLLVSVFDDFQQSRSALYWSRAETQELREQLRRERTTAKASELLQEVTQGIAHDFSNLMDTICTAASILGAGTFQPAPYRAAMEAAAAQAKALIAILQNFALFEEDGFTTEIVDPARAVQEVLEAALIPLRTPHVRVRIKIKELPPIQSNFVVLSRCLNNLIWNAIQAMPAGGTLTVAGRVQNRQVILEVSDTGPGISKEDQERIFIPHFSTKSGHSGLGLYLVRSLARRAGGDIAVHSRPGRGCTFAISFPIAATQQPAPPPLADEERRVTPAG